MNEQKKQVSWGWIIFWCIFFWPVGIFLLIKRLGTDRTAPLKNSSTVMTVSIVLIVLGCLALFNSVGAEDGLRTAAASLLIFVAPGAYLFYLSRKMKKDGEKYQMYLNIVVNQNISNMNEIARKSGLSYDTVESDLQTMITKGYFSNAYIDRETNSIIVSSNEQTGSGTTEYVVVNCPSCSAANKIIVGRVGECEYCGTKLQG